MSIFTPARRVLYAPPAAIQVPYVIDPHAGVLPSYATGFAHNADESKYPELWAGLVAFWPIFLGPTGSRVLDFSGKRNIGSLVANTHWVHGPIGSVLSFDGTGDYITTPFNGTEFAQLNFSFWAKAGVLPVASERYVLDNSLGATGFIIRINGATSDMNAYVYLDSAGLKNVSLTIPDTDWHFYNVSIGSTSLEISIDAGIPVTVAYASDTIKDSAQTMTIGNDSEDGGDDWKGELDNIMIHKRILTTAEIAFLKQEPTALVQLRRRVVMVSVGIGGVVYQELNLTVSADASAAETDTHQMVDTEKAVQADAAAIESDTQQMVDTGKEVSADATASESDTQQMVETGKEISADATASESDTQQMVETGKEVSAAASVSCTDLKVVFELNLEITASGSVVATDAHTMIETGKVVTVVASPAVIDTQAMVETGLGVSADANVSCIDTMGLLAHIAAFMILRQCT